MQYESFTGHITKTTANAEQKRYIGAWLLCLIFYSMEYASRSCPSVMVKGYSGDSLP